MRLRRAAEMEPAAYKADPVKVKLVSYKMAVLARKVWLAHTAASVRKALPAHRMVASVRKGLTIRRQAASGKRALTIHTMAAAKCYKQGDKTVARAAVQLLHPIFHALYNHTVRPRQW